MTSNKKYKIMELLAYLFVWFFVGCLILWWLYFYNLRLEIGEFSTSCLEGLWWTYPISVLVNFFSESIKTTKLLIVHSSLGALFLAYIWVVFNWF